MSLFTSICHDGSMFNFLCILPYAFTLSRKLYCIVMRGGWCNIIVLNVHAPSEEKSDD